MTPDEIARACGEKMWELDATRAALDMELLDISPGTATLSMQVRPDMLNSHGICHGGYIFTLADAAFAYACNSFDVSTVAQNCSISFLVAGRENDRLTAHAREVRSAGRTGIYDVTVSRQSGEVIAEFRGLSRSVGGSILAEDGLSARV